ncbi:sphingosine 1-phosphate receptor 3-like [Micropterus salmoides]|uniref:sphingosine 1-phosphate receptor 3 n=1 Tax=Micropterus salmoides TaxID=27706 RepID=UPI0018EABB73|nr:sphingosine 1-phosphate receptor 3 [Micropterus salmoides]XP_038589166.1 sphingosine 1-phosphate receptor 3 [Micropterus salmoides]XP_038590492.1 sphingosine 1-phosphate receptor 3-like [Micropterus salmoides]XP_038590493.1 sphingosine 1-phosphate receptor 3-like [Micropterus salmoides]
MINPQIFLHYNYTGKLDHRPSVGTSPGTVDAKTIVFLVICSFIVLENLIVLVVIWRNHRFHNRMYFFIANLALCDLLAGVAYLVNLLLSGEKTLQLSPALWFVREGSMFVALGASIFSLLAIAIERHLTMIKMRPYDANKNYRVFLLIGTCWLIAISLGALPVLGWNCLDNLPDCSTVLPLYSKKYVAFCITVYMVLLLAMSVLYARIYILVKSSSRKVSKHRNSEHAMSLLRTVIIVVGVFIACWTPIFVLLLVDVACEQGCHILYKADWFIAVAVLNSAMNPVIYTLASREMRRAFLGLVCGICYRGKASVNGAEARQALEPSRSRSKSWSSQNNPNQNQQSSRQEELEKEEKTVPVHGDVSVVAGGAAQAVLESDRKD